MAITGMKRYIDRDYILSKITAYDIFVMYMPWKFTLNKACKSPFDDDRHPSMIIGTKFDEITFKCFNSKHRGDCFAFVSQLHEKTYKEALDKIAIDFGLLPNSEVKTSDIITYEQPKLIKPPIFIQAKSKPFTKEDKEYLALYKLVPKDLDFCKDTKAHSTLEWGVNRVRQPLKHKEVCFYYHLKNERGEWIKVYRPSAPKDKKWRSSIPFTEMHGVGNISPGCQVGIVTKSIKDAAVIFKYILPCVEIVQAEDYGCITPENKRRLKESCNKLYISFDNDQRGVESSIKLVEELGCNYINPPKELIQHSVTDWSDMCKYYKSAEPMIEFFKKKGLI